MTAAGRSRRARPSAPARALLPDAIEIRGDLLVGTQTVAAALAAGRMAHWGYVEGDGAIMTRFTSQGGHVARAHGNLRGNAGQGAWSSSTDKCGGTWRAHRGGAQRAERSAVN